MGGVQSKKDYMLAGACGDKQKLPCRRHGMWRFMSQRLCCDALQTDADGRASCVSIRQASAFGGVVSHVVPKQCRAAVSKAILSGSGNRRAGRQATHPEEVSKS